MSMMRSASPDELGTLRTFFVNDLEDQKDRAIGMDRGDAEWLSKIAEWQDKARTLESVQQAMELMRDMAWDLWAAVKVLAPLLDHLESDEIEHGSYQNWHERQCVHLCYYYSVQPEAFYSWST